MAVPPLEAPPAYLGGSGATHPQQHQAQAATPLFETRLRQVADTEAETARDLEAQALRQQAESND